MTYSQSKIVYLGAIFGVAFGAHASDQHALANPRTHSTLQATKPSKRKKLYLYNEHFLELCNQCTLCWKSNKHGRGSSGVSSGSRNGTQTGKNNSDES